MKAIRHENKIESIGESAATLRRSRELTCITHSAPGEFRQTVHYQELTLLRRANRSAAGQGVPSRGKEAAKRGLTLAEESQKVAANEL